MQEVSHCSDVEELQERSYSTNMTEISSNINVLKIDHKKRFVCKQCSVVCSSRYGFTEHLRKHTGDRPFSCKQCDRSFKRIMGLRKHEQFVHGAPGSKQFNCPDCKVTSKNLGNVVRHYMAVHRASRRFICSLCLVRYSQNQELQNHLSSKHNIVINSINNQEKKSINEIYVLPTVNTEEKPSTELNKIEEIVKEEKDKLKGLDELVKTIKKNTVVEEDEDNGSENEVANETATTLVAMASSAKESLVNKTNGREEADNFENHNELAVISDVVKSCPETWISVVVLDKPDVCNENNIHLKGDNCSRREVSNLELLIQMEKPKWRCDSCGKVFRERKRLLRHIKVHNDSKNYKCNECDKNFREVHNLIVHYRTHTGERPYSCPTCDKKYRYHKDYVDHLASHSNEKRYKCDYCDNRYLRKRDCIRHKLLHNTDHRFKCEECGKGFSRRYLMHNHILRHQKQEQSEKGAVKHIFECDICRKVYKTFHGFLQHKTKHTGMMDHQCHICSKSFISSNKLQSHLRNHIPRVKNVTCSDCQRKFSSQDTLKIHKARFHKIQTTVFEEQHILPASEVPNYDIEVIIENEMSSGD